MTSMIIHVHVQYKNEEKNIKQTKECYCLLQQDCCFVSSRILKVQSADEFYTTMGQLTQEMLDDHIIDPDDLIKVRARTKVTTEL